MDAADTYQVKRETGMERIIALAGNPNVGKSTIFNSLTGMRQHTGNWPGKTVACAQGRASWKDQDYIFVDLPGTYSLMAHSAEEEVARDFICFGGADATVVVCDATCLERNLNLVLQIQAVTSRVIVCVNLCDEAKKKKIQIDFEILSRQLGVPVIAASAARGAGLAELMDAVRDMTSQALSCKGSAQDCESCSPPGQGPCLSCASSSFRCPNSASPCQESASSGGDRISPCHTCALADACGTPDFSALFNEQTALSFIQRAEAIAQAAVTAQDPDYYRRDNRLDRLFTGPRTAVPVMLLFLTVIFWLTISGANYPSALLSGALFRVEDGLMAIAAHIGAPAWLSGALIQGMYRVLAWVVSVMLPPMAIFFPLFTLLEDFGYLPRVAFNLDKYFKKCAACGKQALTMCMGFGCNACGVSGCRIIDSPRERLIAILTNAFVPCNGRFPTLLAILSMFLVGLGAGVKGTLLSALLMTALILLSILMTFAVSKLLSRTALQGEPSSFTLELPPYRRPQFAKVLMRSLLDRTLFVLGRAAMVAAPAGLVIWLLSNVTMGGVSLLAHFAGFLDPLGRLMGMDGVLLVAFLLGWPANEIVLPIALMCYLSAGTLTDYESLASLRTILVENGWTLTTALCTMTFCLFHWPCSTTCITIYKETGSLKWTALGFALPTAVGGILCMILAMAGRALM